MKTRERIELFWPMIKWLWLALKYDTLEKPIAGSFYTTAGRTIREIKLTLTAANIDRFRP